MKRILMVICFLVILSGCESETVLDCGENENITGVCIDVTLPVISGVDDVQIQQGTIFDPMLGVRAVDDFDGDITSSIIVSENVDTSIFGVYLVKYTVSDAFNNKTIKLRYVTITFNSESLGDNLVANGDFDNGFDGWDVYTVDDGDADFDVIDEELVITIKSILEGRYYAPRLNYSNIIFKQGSYYQISFQMKADDSRNVHIQIGELLNQDPWFDDFRSNADDKIILLTEEYQTFEFEFLMNEETNFNGGILFEMGGVGSNGLITTIYLDDLVVKEVDLG